MALVILNSLDWVPERIEATLELLSRSCLVVAIAAIGLQASFKGLMASGWRPMLLLVFETLFLAGLVLAILYLLN